MDTPRMLPRHGTWSRKWAQAAALSQPGRPGLAMGISDMDLRAPEAALEAGRALLKHGVMGYGFDLDGYKASVAGWMARRHGWEVAPARILPVPGTLSVLSLAIVALTRPGAAVVHLEPGYKHFRWAVEKNGRRLHTIDLAETGAGYRLPDDLETLPLPDDAEMLLLCSPHNPTGRVWHAAELERLLAFARRHDLIVVSDEIHMDFAYPGHRHIPLATLAGPQDRVIVAAGTTKNFNLAGLALSSAIFTDDRLQAPMEAHREWLYMESSTLSFAMATAALREGEAWMDATKTLLGENRARVVDEPADTPGLSLHPPEATYLAWVKLDGDADRQAAMALAIAERAAIRVEPGADFGAAGAGHLRLNFGAAPEVVAEAIARLNAAAREVCGA